MGRYFVCSEVEGYVSAFYFNRVNRFVPFFSYYHYQRGCPLGELHVHVQAQRQVPVDISDYLTVSHDMTSAPLIKTETWHPTDC